MNFYDLIISSNVYSYPTIVHLINLRFIYLGTHHLKACYTHYENPLGAISNDPFLVSSKADKNRSKYDVGF